MEITFAFPVKFVYETLVTHNSVNTLLFSKFYVLCDAYGHPKYRYNERRQCKKVENACFMSQISQ